jgi:hypothetical protein
MACNFDVRQNGYSSDSGRLWRVALENFNVVFLGFFLAAPAIA